MRSRGPLPRLQDAVTYATRLQQQLKACWLKLGGTNPIFKKRFTVRCHGRIEIIQGAWCVVGAGDGRVEKPCVEGMPEYSYI